MISLAYDDCDTKDLIMGRSFETPGISLATTLGCANTLGKKEYQRYQGFVSRQLKGF